MWKNQGNRNGNTGRCNLILLTLTISACSYQEKPQELPEVVRVEITENIVLNWHNVKQQFIKDSLFGKSLEHFESEKSHLIYQILNTKEIEARVCSMEQDLVLGDMAFLFLDEIENIGYSQVFEWQFCLLIEGCRYPDGVLWYLSEHRTKAKVQIENFLK